MQKNTFINAMKIKKIFLRPVGKQRNSNIQAYKARQLQESCRSNRIENHYDDQVTPLTSNDKFSLDTSKSLRSKPKKFNVIEDPRESSFSHYKFIFLQKINFILVSLSFMLELIKTQIDMSQIINSELYANNLTNVISMCTACLALIMLLRYVCLNELEIDQKKFYVVRKYRGIFADIGRFFRRWDSLKYYLLELLLILPHPISLISGYTVKIFQSLDEIYINHEVNNILSIISLVRVYIIFRSMVNLSIYSTPRSSRLCHHNGINQDFLYSVKCLLRQIPLQTIASVFCILLITLGYGLNLSEGTLLKSNPQLVPTGFENLQNCFWCIFITMPTVGYGDIYPKTALGRIIIFITAISGVISSSLLIVSLSNYLTMQPNQSKSHLTLQRLGHQEQLKTQAKQALLQTMKMSKFLASSNKSNDKQKVRQFFTNLKKKIDSVKLRNRHIKSLVNTNNLMEEMNRLFSVFKESLEQIYRKQINLRQNLLALDQWDRRSSKIRAKTFAKSIQNLIRQKI